MADVGAGTGILSVFCVHAGAKKGMSKYDIYLSLLRPQGADVNCVHAT